MTDPKIAQYAEAIQLSIEGKSLTEIAKKLGISRSTLYAWRHDPAYSVLHDELCEGAKHAARFELTMLAENAATAVRDCLSKEQTDAQLRRNVLRLRAAEAVLDRLGLTGAAHRTPGDNLTDAELDELLVRMGYRKSEGSEEDGGAQH